MSRKLSSVRATTKGTPLANLDPMCRRRVSQNGNMAIPWFLMTSYLYYRHDVSLLSDELFDEMAKGMLTHWDALEHRHKALISIEDLRAGTGYALDWDALPGIVKAAAEQLKDLLECPARYPELMKES